MKMEERIKEIIEKEIKPALAMEGGDIEFVCIEDGVVKVRLGGACVGCPLSQMTLVNFVEATIKRSVPEIKGVEAVQDFKSTLRSFFE